MKPPRTLITLLLCAAAVVLSACSESEQRDESMDVLKKNFNETWDSIKAYGAEQKDAFASKIDLARNDLREAGSRLEEKLRNADDVSEAKAQELTWNLREAQDELKQAVDDLGAATEESWEKAKAEVGQAWKRTVNAYNAARDELER
jgi:DNA anti-recombination protein RmuC